MGFILIDKNDVFDLYIFTRYLYNAKYILYATCPYRFMSMSMLLSVRVLKNKVSVDVCL